jgi:hypothetical protein
MTCAPTRIFLHPNRRSLQTGDGEPFFYLADTAWEWIHRLNSEETEIYLNDRAKKGFTVIQTVILAEMDGLSVPTAEGNLPFINGDVSRPQESFFVEVDQKIRAANQRGLVVALLPAWGDKWNNSTARPLLNPANAKLYGIFLGRRYRDDSLIWILGGDRKVETGEQRRTLDELAHGLREGDGGGHLLSFHPNGNCSSSDFAIDSLIDFHMIQSGHCDEQQETYRYVQRDYALADFKPTLDGEICYEDHPIMTVPSPGALWIPLGRRFRDIHVRRAAYWSIFAGACGVAYGAQAIWQFWEPRHTPHPGATPQLRPLMNWRDALDLPGASQLVHMKNLLLSSDYFEHIPDVDAVLTQSDHPQHRVVALRTRNFSHAYFYSQIAPTLFCRNTTLAWFDPRNGTRSEWILVPKGFDGWIQPPQRENDKDWVVILNEAERR